MDPDLRDQGGISTIQGWPDVVIDGDTDTCFSYIKEHLEYIIFELLKNVSMDAFKV